MEDEIVKSINHYKEAIIKYRKRNDHEKTLDCLQKLNKLPIETQHLEQTKIGITVNSLSKVVGEVGDVSKSLVNKWKIIVCKNIDREELKLKQRSDEKHKSHSSSSSNKEKPEIKRKHSNNEENLRSIKKVRTSNITDASIKVKTDSQDLKPNTSREVIEANRGKSSVESKKLTTEANRTQKPYLSENTLTKPEPKIIISEEKNALEQMFNKKRQVTKIYSGSKTTVAKFPSLYQMCVEHVKKNLNTLVYTNGATFNALKPVLQCATAKQLHKLEYYNPYLIEDTGEMWKTFCKLQFSSKTREEMETWRDLYLRSIDEEEAKLKSMSSISSRLSHGKQTTKRQIVFLNTDAPVNSRSYKTTKNKNTFGNIDKSSAKVVSIADSKPKKGTYSEHNPSSQPTKTPLMKKAMAMMKGFR